MEGKFENIITGLVIIALVGFLSLSFSLELANKYGKSLTNEQNLLNLSGINDSLLSLQAKGEAQLNTARQTNAFKLVGDFILSGIWTIGFGIFDVVGSFYNLIFIQVFNNIFHIPPVVTGSIIFLLSIAVILAIWRLLRAGE